MVDNSTYRQLDGDEPATKKRFFSASAGETIRDGLLTGVDLLGGLLVAVRLMILAVMIVIVLDRIFNYFN